MVSFPKFTKSTAGYVRKNFSKVRNSANIISNEIKDTGSYYKNSVNTGWGNGSRLSKIKRFKPFKSLRIKLFSSIVNIKIKQEHLPTILGGIGTVAPIPGGTFLGYGLGKLINKILKKH